MKLFFETQVNSNLETVKKGFDRDLFLKLKPPFVSLKLEKFDGCEKGNEVHLALGLPGMLQKWVSVVTQSQSDEKRWLFVDEGKVLPPPLKVWRHEHQVMEVAPNRCLITDSISFDCYNSALNKLMYWPLWLSFSVRSKVYRKAFGTPQAT